MKISTFAGIVGLSVSIAVSGAASAAPVDLIVNGGFETGNFSSWSAPAIGSSGCDQVFNVSSSGSGAGCTGYPPIPSGFVNPATGTYAAYAAFDGAGPETKTLTQTFTVPNSVDSAIASWDAAIGFGNGWVFPQARVFSVAVLDATNAVVGTIFSQSFTNGPGGVFQNWTTTTADITTLLAGLAGQTASLQFSLFIPQSFTGPGAFGLDNVSLNVTEGAPAPGALALLGLGLLGLAGARRRKQV